MSSEHHTWTETDQAWAHREAYAERVGWFEVIRTPRYRELVPVPVSHLDRARAKHRAPDPDDEEPSRVYIVARQRRRTTPLQALVLGGIALGVVTVGIIAVRSLMGAS
jgi:hypothetical protein